MKKFLSLVLALVMTMSLVTISAGAKDFKDDSSINYKEAVDVMSAVGVIDGYADGSFGATGTLTRGAAAKIICNMILGPTTAGALSANAAPFKDVPANHTFAGYIAYCSSQGIINGYGDGTFKPAGTVTGYQFLKMLLGALGYDSAVESFTGANWTVNVAKLGISLGLVKGNDEFVGTKALTREEACLYGFNTMKATMVEYDSKSTVVINGVTVVTGGSKAKEMAGTGYDNYKGGDKNDTLQFCEKYFTKLKLTEGSDAFQRPASIWKLKNEKIGTYTNEADQTYTAEVSVDTIYKDLGLTARIPAVDVAQYTNGFQNKTPNAIVKGDTSTKLGGNGVLTEVFYNDDNHSVVISLINTGVATVSGVKAASSSADRSITLDVKTIGTPNINRVFETENFAAKDLVSFTAAYNESTNRYDVQSVALLEKTSSGKLTAWTGASSTDSTSNFTAGGTTYKYNTWSYVESTNHKVADFTVDESELDVYCDANGYALYVEGTKGETKYAAVIGVGQTNAYGSETKGVTLLLPDGTQKEVVAKLKTNSTPLVGWNSGANLVSEIIGEVVTYSVGSDGIYTLTLQDAWNDTDKANTKFENGKSAIILGDGTDLYTTSETIFFVCTKDNANKMVYNVYKGYSEMPTLDGAVVHGSSYKTNSDYIKQVDAAYIAADNVVGITGVKTFVALEKGHKVITDSTGSYFLAPAVVDGEVTTVKLATDAMPNLLSNVTSSARFYALNSVTSDKNGIITYAAALAEETTSTTTSTYYNLLGVVASGGNVVGFGGNKNTATNTVYWAYTKDTKVYYVSDDYKTVTESSVSGIVTDILDRAYFTVDTNSKTLKEVFIVDNTDKTINYTDVTVKFDNLEENMTVTFNGKAYPITAALKASGLSIPNVVAGTYNYTIEKAGYATYSDKVVVTAANYGNVAKVVKIPTYVEIINSTKFVTLNTMTLQLNSDMYDKVYVGFDVQATVAGSQAPNSAFDLQVMREDVDGNPVDGNILHTFINDTTNVLTLSPRTSTVKVPPATNFDTMIFDLARAFAYVELTIEPANAGDTISDVTVNGVSKSIDATGLVEELECDGVNVVYNVAWKDNGVAKTGSFILTARHFLTMDTIEITLP